MGNIFIRHYFHDFFRQVCIYFRDHGPANIHDIFSFKFILCDCGFFHCQNLGVFKIYGNHQYRFIYGTTTKWYT